MRGFDVQFEDITRRLQERCDVLIHENEFGIPRDELLEVVRGYDAVITMLTEKVDGEFQVRATYANYVDRDRLEHDGDDFAATAGVSWRPDERWRLAGELFYSPLDVVRDPAGRAPSENDPLFNFRLAATWSFR